MVVIIVMGIEQYQVEIDFVESSDLSGKKVMAIHLRKKKDFAYFLPKEVFE